MRYGKIKELAEQNNIPYNTLISRLSRGWDVERAISQPVKKHAKNAQKRGSCVYLIVTADKNEMIVDELPTLKAVAERFGLTEAGASKAVTRGNRLRGTNRKIVRCMLDDE